MLETLLAEEAGFLLPANAEMALEHCELAIERHRATYIPAGEALSTIAEHRLYRVSGYATFEAYLAERWQLDREYAYKLMRAARVARNVESIPQSVPSLTQAIQLATLPPKEQQAVAREVNFDDLSVRDLKALLRKRQYEAFQQETTTRVERDERRQEKVESLRQPLALTEVGQFPVIYADPPWRYDFSVDEDRAIENQYPTMELDAICRLPVAHAATDHAVLFLWATSPKLAEAFSVIEAWGFQYLTSMVWIKDKIGMGYYARQQHELLLIAKRGEPPTPDPSNRPPSVLSAPRTIHSRKPPEFYGVIERMYPGLPYLELFAREARTGWTAWGNEAGES